MKHIFFFKLIKNEFVGKMAYIPNNYITSKISNFNNYSNYNFYREFYFFQNGKDIIDSKFNFYIGKNLSSNENILIFHETI